MRREKPYVRERSGWGGERSVCAWLLTPLSTLHHAIQTTQLAPFTFSIRAACASSLFTIRAIIEKFEGCGFAAIAPPPFKKILHISTIHIFALCVHYI